MGEIYHNASCTLDVCVERIIHIDGFKFEACHYHQRAEPKKLDSFSTKDIQRIMYSI